MVVRPLWMDGVWMVVVEKEGWKILLAEGERALVVAAVSCRLFSRSRKRVDLSIWVSVFVLLWVVYVGICPLEKNRLFF